jgi:hypothetical protein
MKSISKFLGALVVCLIASFTTSTVFGVSPLAAFGGSVGISTALSFVPQSQGALMSLQVSMWTGELLNKFRHQNGWLNVIPSQDNFVNNNAINLADIGADPAVLINNTTYPIATSGRTDTPLVISLNKFQTENTKVTHDELYALPYDKPGSVIRQHRETLEETTAMYGLHSIAPAGNTASTPVIKTTGADNGSDRKRLTSADIINLKKKFDELKVPKEGRILVLCADHVSDLLLEDKNGSFAQIYHNAIDGVIAKKFYGFQIFEQTYNPVYNGSTVAKKAFNAAAAPTTDCNASTAFHTSRIVKATGSVKMFYSLAENDPKNRESVMGFELYHVVIPKKEEFIAAIISDIVEEEG